MSLRGQSLYFFLTPAEQKALLDVFEARQPVAYHRADTAALPEVPVFTSLLQEASLGYLAIGDWNHSPSYLLTFPTEGVVVEEITLRKGGYAYAVGLGKNPTLTLLRPSGQFTEGVLIAGSVQTCSFMSYSALLFQRFVKLLKQHTRRIGMFWVGPEAEAKLRLGWRLVTSASSPQEYDLAFAS
jgi:hypothetical protein